VKALSHLRHPNVVSCLGTVVAPPTYCLVLEYCEGGDVREALESPTATGFFWLVAEGVATGMAYLHRRGILHRDLKTSNVLVDRSGAPDASNTPLDAARC
jgi:serine/threonine protein kinase